jgi:dynein heavy chain
MLDSQNKQIEIVKAYGIQNFRDFIKTLKLLTGVEGKECTFLFTDTQIIKEQFLEDINSLLNSGEVPNMWEPEEKKQILDSTRDYNVKIGRIGII